MSDPTDVFSGGEPTQIPAGQQTPADPANSASSDDPYKNFLEQIRNERGEQKYDSIPKALEGLRNAQEFIPQLQEKLDAQEEELKKLREAATKHESVDELVSRLTAQQASNTTVERGLGEQEAAALFEHLMKERDATLTSQSNKRVVHEKLVETYGDADSAVKAVEEKAKQLGTSAKQLGDLASQNPQLVLALFSDPTKTPSSTPPKGSINSEGLLGKPRPEDGLTRPAKSLLSGATYRDQAEYMRQIREDVYKRFNVEK